jgi:hypothetical protein
VTALTFAVGRRYATRDGAIVLLREIIPAHRRYSILVGTLERWGNGVVPEEPIKMSFGPDGHRRPYNEDFDDLVVDIEAMG